MHTNVFEVELEGKNYNVFVTYKCQRNAYLRYKNGDFYVTCPSLTSKKKIIDFVLKSGPKLLERINKPVQKNYSFEEGYIYIFGQFYRLKISDKFRIEEYTVFAKDIADLEKNLRKLLVKYLEQSVRKFEQLMSISKPYQISVKKMKSRYGSNSQKTHRLHFQLDLVHFSYEIIDSVVVHELAHEFYRNHQRGFYSCVLKYCQNYYELKKKLRTKVYQ